MTKHEFALESFKNMQDLIKFIDQKSGAVLVIAGFVLTGFIEYLKNLEYVGCSASSSLGKVCFFTGLSTVINLVAVIYLSIFKVLKPRLAKHFKKDELSLFYFEHLSKFDTEAIVEAYTSLTEEEMLKHINKQQLEVSGILLEKSRRLSDSFNFLFFSVFSLLIFIITANLL